VLFISADSKGLWECALRTRVPGESEGFVRMCSTDTEEGSTIFTMSINNCCAIRTHVLRHARIPVTRKVEKERKKI
jgi:hypothetical protein